MSAEMIRLTDPDISGSELELVEAVLCTPQLGQGRMV